MKRIIQIAICCLSVASCATCREQPVACAMVVGGSVIAVSVVANRRGHGYQPPPPRRWSDDPTH